MLQHGGEIVPFAEWALAELHPHHILEIGTGPGGLTEFFCTLATGIVISIDVSTDVGVQRNSYLRSLHRNFYGILSDSHDVTTIIKVDEILNGRTCDLLFIDGDHSYSGVKQDANTYKSFVKRDGWVAFHDINSDKFNGPEMGVPQFWRELQGEKKSWSVGHEWGGIGVIRV